MGGLPPIPQLRPFQNVDPLEQVGKALSVRDLQQRGQLQQQQMQMGQLELQEKQRQLQDEQTFNQILAQNNGDIAKSLPQLAGKVSPQTYMGVQKFHLETTEKYGKITETQLDNDLKRNGLLLGLVQQAKALPPDVYQQQWPNIAQQALSIHPDLKGQLDPSQPIPQQSLDHIALGYQTEAQYLAREKENREAAKAPFEQREAVAKASLAEQQAAAGGTDIGMIEMQSWLKQNPRKTPADYMKYKATLVPAFNFNLQAGGVGGNTPVPTKADGTPLQGEDLIKTFGVKGPMIRALIEGRQSLPSSFAQKSPYWQDVMNKLYQVDPQFSEQRAQLRKAYTTGSQSKEINAINTATGHVGVLNDAIDALKNGDVKALNRIANAYKVQTGTSAVTVFNTIVHRVGPEISKAYIGAGGSAGERGADEKDFDPNLGPQQLKANVAITANLLGSKIAALGNQWEQNKAPTQKSFEDQFLTPEARKTLSRLAGNGQPKGALMYARDPQGKLHSAPVGTALPQGWTKQ